MKLFIKRRQFPLLVIVMIIGGGFLANHYSSQAQRDLCGFERIVEANVWGNTDFCNSIYGPAQFNWGGVARDGITPIYPAGYVYPENIAVLGERAATYAVGYQTIEEGNAWLADVSPVLVVEVNDEARAYPLGILTRHEIANTEIDGVPIAVTFCPLCNAGIAFERELNGQVFHFGVSGYLRNSDLVMWDHETESWWQQATGEGLVGEMAGEQLTFVPASMVSWADFKAGFPNGQVLAPPREDTFGYDYNPYAGYDTSSVPFLYRGFIDERLPAMTRVLTYVSRDNDTPIAVGYAFEILENTIVANDVVAGVPLVAFWQPGAASALGNSRISEAQDVGSAVLFERTLSDGRVLTFVAEGNTIKDAETGSIWNIFGKAIDGELSGTQLQQRIAVTHFWFAAQAFNPEIILWDVDTTTDTIRLENAE